MDYGKMFGLFMAVLTKMESDFQDKELTVSELLGVIQAVVNQLGVGNKVIINLNKKKEIEQPK